MLNEFSPNVTTFFLVLIVIMLLWATLQGVRMALGAAFTLLAAAARVTAAMLVVALLVALMLVALLW